MENITFTYQEVEKMLVIAQMFANNNNGLRKVKGFNYGERAKTIIQSIQQPTIPSALDSLIEK